MLQEWLVASLDPLYVTKGGWCWEVTYLIPVPFLQWKVIFQK